MPTTTGTTRLAPSPTGALHLGNARTFLVNALLARQHGWQVRMRIEDLDGPRVRADAIPATLEDLAWLGLTWAEPVVYQSRRGARYAAALDQLARDGWAYPCTCTRKDIEQAASAPHRDDAPGTYPGTCRGRYTSADEAHRLSGRRPAWRVRVDDRPVRVADRFAGDRTFDLSRTGGDFVVSKNDGLAAYQLAVVLDDHDAGVDGIVRGDDLLDSAARQIHLRRLLGLADEVAYWHVPLVVGPDGRRLAKRHGDTRLAAYRAAGATPERVLGLLGYWCGLLPRREEATMADLAARFGIDRLPREPIVFREADDAFLRA